jgi:hypothetical protein
LGVIAKILFPLLTKSLIGISLKAKDSQIVSFSIAKFFLKIPEFVGTYM